MNTLRLRSTVSGLAVLAVTMLGLATPAAADAHAVVKNPFSPRGESWVSVPEQDRIWLQTSLDASVDEELDDDVFSYLAAGDSCTLNNGDTLTGPALVDGDEDSSCAMASGEGSKTPIPIGFDLNFAGVTRSALYVNSNGAIGFSESNAYDDPLHYSAYDDSVSSLSVLGIDAGVFQAGTGSELPGTNVWVAQTTVNGKQAFVVSWETLRSHGDNELTASAQLVLLNDGNGDFTAWFNYDDFGISDEGYSSGTFFVDLRNSDVPNVYKAYDVEYLTIPGVADANGCISLSAYAYDAYLNGVSNPGYARVLDADKDLVSLLDSCGETDVNWQPAEGTRYVFSEEVNYDTYSGHDSMPIGWSVYEIQEDGTLEWNATELQYNVDLMTLLNDGSNPLINQSLNTDVPGRYVIGMRGGKTWGDPGVGPNKEAQAELTLNTGTLVFDGSALTLTAAGGSGTGEIRYVVVSGPCVVDGDQLVATGLGTCVVKAIKLEDDQYAEVSSAEVSFTIERGALGPIEPGDSALTVNGQPQEVTIQKSEDSSGLEIVGDGFTMRLVGKDGKGNPLGVSEDSVLKLEQSRTAEVSGSGFEPNSEIKLYLHSVTVYLGSVSTDANGDFTGSVQIPLSVAAGLHHLQAVGYAADGSVRVLTLNVLLQALAGQKVKAKQYIFFNANSWGLTPKAKRELKRLAKLLAGAKNNVVVINGSFQSAGSSADNRKLAVRRAKVVRNYLKLTLGVKGKFVLGVAKQNSGNPKARKAVILANYGG